MYEGGTRKLPDMKLEEVENSHKGNRSSPDTFPADVLAHCWVDLLTDTYRSPLISIKKKKSIKLSSESLATLEDLCYFDGFM